MCPCKVSRNLAISLGDLRLIPRKVGKAIEYWLFSSKCCHLFLVRFLWKPFFLLAWLCSVCSASFALCPSSHKAEWKEAPVVCVMLCFRLFGVLLWIALSSTFLFSPTCQSLTVYWSHIENHSCPAALIFCSSPQLVPSKRIPAQMEIWRQAFLLLSRGKSYLWLEHNRGAVSNREPLLRAEPTVSAGQSSLAWDSRE